MALHVSPRGTICLAFLPRPMHACRAAAGGRRTQDNQFATEHNLFLQQLMVCYSHPGEGGSFSKKQLEKSICIKTGISCSVQLGTAEVPHHQLVLGKRPVQKSTDSFLPAPTQLPGLPRGPAPHRSCSPGQAGSIPLVLSNQEEVQRVQTRTSFA